MRRLFIAIVIAVLASVSGIARGDEDAMLSVFGSESLTERFVARMVPNAPAEPEAHHPELVGGALIGAWFLYKSRRRRIV
jgi:hypothetical protein